MRILYIQYHRGHEVGDYEDVSNGLGNSLLARGIARETGPDAGRVSSMPLPPPADVPAPPPEDLTHGLGF